MVKLMSWTTVSAVDARQHAVLPHPFSREAAAGVSGLPHISKDAVFLSYSSDFRNVLGPEPALKLVAEEEWDRFHEAGVYNPQRQSILVTSNRILANNGQQRISVTELSLTDPPKCIDVPPSHHGLVMANGGTNFKEGYLFCDQGDASGSPSSLVYVVAQSSGWRYESIINNYHGRQFNSLNDVVVHSDGSVWFTDPDYGSEQAFKGKPQLPNQIYRFDPASSDIRVVETGVEKCNGILFSPDFRTCYISDTAFIKGTGECDARKGGHIYAYDVAYKPDGTSYGLQNKRVFAFTDAGAPDGMKCDTEGNVYAGCFDGVHYGDLLGKIVLPNGDGCANLVFGPPGRLFIFSEKRLYEARIAASGVLVPP